MADRNQDRNKAFENASRYAYMRDFGHLQYVNKADKCDRYFAAMQWEESVRRKLEAQGRPVITINKVFATLAAIMGEQIGQRMDIRYLPARDGSDEVAEILTKVFLQISNNNHLDWVESEVFADGSITSRGFYDIRIDFDDQMRGEVRIKSVNPRNVLIDPGAEDYDPDTWKEVIMTKWLSLNDIELIYGKEFADELKHTQGTEFYMAYDFIDEFPTNFSMQPQHPIDPSQATDPLSRHIRVIERQFFEVVQAFHFVDKVTGDMRLAPHNWSRPKVEAFAERFDLGVVKKAVERIRWRVSAGHLLLHDEISPYKHFTIVPYFPFFRRGLTIGLAENILSPQDFLNKTISQELHIINTTANSGYKVKQNALKNMTTEDLEQRGAETGIVLELDEVGNLDKIEPNQIPSGLERISFRMDEFIKEVSGISDNFRGFDREDVAAKAIEAKQRSSGVNLAKPFDNLAKTRELMAGRVLDLVQQFYTEERVLQIVGRDLDKRSEQIVVNEQTPEGEVINDLTLGEYSVAVSSIPARETFDQTQFDEAMRLRELGISIPDDILVEFSHLARKPEIAERIKQLNGGADPTKRQQAMADAELELKQLEVQEKAAEMRKDMAEAMLAEARAKKALAEAKETSDKSPSPEFMRKLEEMNREFELKLFEIRGELELKRAELEATMDIKERELDIKEAEAEARAEQQQERDNA